MMNALIKKEFTEVMYSMFGKGKKKKKMGMIGYAALFLYLFALMEFLFFGMTKTLCGPFVDLGMDWVYFSIMGLMALCLGVFGTVFITQSKLYAAKDNDILLSMPIPTGSILVSRIIVLFLINLFDMSLILFPTYLNYADYTFKADHTFSFFTIVFWILNVFLLSLLALVLSCFFGWVNTMLSRRMKHKNSVTVVLSVVFMLAYLFVVQQANQILSSMLMYGGQIAAVIRTWFYPVYTMGMACAGSISSMLIFTSICLVCSAITYTILARSFLNIVGTTPVTVKRVYHRKPLKQSTPEKALLQKELNRFFNTPTYLLNCGLGNVLMVVFGVVAVFKGDMYKALIQSIFPGDLLYGVLLVTAVLLLIVSSNMITSCSISLEGKNLWILQSIPVSFETIVRAKCGLQILVNGISLIPSAVLFGIAFDFGIAGILTILFITEIYNILWSFYGLAVNLKHPNLNWISETYAIKRSSATMITLFSGWGIGVAVFLLAFGLASIVSGWIIALSLCVLFGLSAYMVYRWLITKGRQIFISL